MKSIDPKLLEILRCPETLQPLDAADPALIEALNRRISAGALKNSAGQTVKDAIEAGLVRRDRKVLYPIRDEIPVMLIDEAIPLAE